MPVLKSFKNGAWENVSGMSRHTHSLDDILGLQQEFATEEHLNASILELSNNTQEALNEAKQYTDTEVAALVNSAPETLDTIGELAAAFEENQDMIETLDAAITEKASKTELQETKEELENKIITSLRPLPAVTSYSRPTAIPIISGMQLVFYAACAGTFTLTLGTKTYTHTLASANDVGWVLWVQTGETDGSFISPVGTRKYLEVGSRISSADVSFSFNSADYSNPNPNYIIITIE